MSKQPPTLAPSPRWHLPNARQIERAFQVRRTAGQQAKQTMEANAQNARDRLFGVGVHTGLDPRVVPQW
jgi:hypothetical protein